MGREPFLRRCRSTFPCTTLTCAGVSGITWYFYQLSPSEWYVTHVLLTSPPFSGKQASPAIRLACLRRAASVRSEPGSNSPWLFISPKADDFHFNSNPFSSWKEPAAYFLFPYLYAASCVYSPKKLFLSDSLSGSTSDILQKGYPADLTLSFPSLTVLFKYLSPAYLPASDMTISYFHFLFQVPFEKKNKKNAFFLNFITMIFQFFSIKRHKKEKKKVWQLPTFPQKQYHRRKRAWLPCSVWERVLPLHYGHQTFYYWKHEDNPHATGCYAGDAGFSCLQS